MNSSRILMTVSMARSFVKRPNAYDCTDGKVICKATSIFVKNFVDCTHGDVICNTTSIFRYNCMTAPMARSFARRPAFFITNSYDCTHGDVIHKATSIYVTNSYDYTHGEANWKANTIFVTSSSDWTIAGSFARRPAFTLRIRMPELHHLVQQLTWSEQTRG